VLELTRRKLPEIVNIGCLGAGSITLNVSGGTGPYTIEWSNGNSGLVLDSITEPGTFGVQVTDANGCVLVDAFQVLIDDSAELEITEVLSSQPGDCSAADGRIGIEVSPASDDYAYSIDGGQTMYGSSEFNGLVSGAYLIMAQDTSGGCSVTDDAITTSLQSELRRLLGSA